MWKFLCPLPSDMRKNIEFLRVPWTHRHALLVRVPLKASYGVMLEWSCEGKTEVLGGHPVPLPLYRPQSYMDCRDRIQASAVKGPRVTAWTIARPSKMKFMLNNTKVQLSYTKIHFVSLTKTILLNSGLGNVWSRCLFRVLCETHTYTAWAKWSYVNGKAGGTSSYRCDYLFKRGYSSKKYPNPCL
jgi:hypothetical protein